MTDSAKKVEVRFGAFACTIEGYDDPVAQMREVLAMMQRMISETPALAEAAEFNADDVKDALKEGDTTPGVVVIRSADTPLIATLATYGLYTFGSVELAFFMAVRSAIVPSYA